MTSHAASSPTSATQTYPSRRELRQRSADRVMVPEPAPAPAEERAPATPSDPVTTTTRQAHTAEPVSRATADVPSEPQGSRSLSSATRELLSVLRTVSPAPLDAIDLASVTALPREDLRMSLDTLLSQQLVTAANQHPQTPDRQVRILYRAS